MNPDSWRLRFRLLLALVSGGVAFCAFPPVDYGWAALVALVPLFMALRGATGRAGFLVGLTFGLAFMGPLIWWISLFGYLGWGVLVVVQSLFLAAFGWFGAWASRSAIGRFIGVPLLFAAVEVSRTWWPLGGFAWGGLGYAQHDAGPLLALARIGGVHVVTLALAVVNALIAQVVASGRVWRRSLAGALAAGIAIAPLWLPLGLTGAPVGELDIALVQGNVPPGRFTGFADRIGREGPEDLTIITNHVLATQQLAADPPDLVVWPENSVDRDPFVNPQVAQMIEQAARTVRASLLVGAILDGPGEGFRNVNLLYDSTGRLTSPRYEKIHLVPFGEYVPWSWLRRYVKALEQIPSDGVPGKTPVVFDVGEARIGTVICFESTYPSLVREFVREGAELIVVSTNNASFRRSPASRQHVAMSQLRAVEEGRTVMHAAISGITAVIDARGQILTSTPLFEQRVVRRAVPLARGRTPYGRFGETIELGFLALGAVVVVIAAARMVGRRREQRYASVEEELWGGEEMLRRAIAEREAADALAAARIAERAPGSVAPSPEEPEVPGEEAPPEERSP